MRIPVPTLVGHAVRYIIGKGIVKTLTKFRVYSVRFLPRLVQLQAASERLDAKMVLFIDENACRFILADKRSGHTL